MSVTISCSAGYGSGGLGSRLAEMVECARSEGRLARYFTTRTRSRSDAAGVQISNRLIELLCNVPPLRFNPGWRQHFTFDAFDRTVAGALQEPCDTFIGFADQALRTFRRARNIGYRQLELVSPTAHIEHVARQHRLAFEQFSIERDWLSASHRRKTIQEYELADRIHVASEYTRHSFLDRGCPADKLYKIPSDVSDRFAPEVREPAADNVYRIVYTGALSVAKGVPLLVEAFERLRWRNAELILVGYTGTRGMRKYLERKRQQLPGIVLAGGDPLPHLRRANVFVYPSYQDGFGRAPLEAMRCGVPVIVTEDTGMKELVREGVDGHVVPTGDVEALCERLDQIRKSSR